MNISELCVRVKLNLGNVGISTNVTIIPAAVQLCIGTICASYVAANRAALERQVGGGEQYIIKS